MQLNTIQRKKAREGLEAAFGKEKLVDRMYRKHGLDGFIQELGSPKSFRLNVSTFSISGLGFN